MRLLMLLLMMLLLVPLASATCVTLDRTSAVVAVTNLFSVGATFDAPVDSIRVDGAGIVQAVPERISSTNYRIHIIYQDGIGSVTPSFAITRIDGDGNPVVTTCAGSTITIEDVGSDAEDLVDRGRAAIEGEADWIDMVKLLIDVVSFGFTLDCSLKNSEMITASATFATDCGAQIVNVRNAVLDEPLDSCDAGCEATVDACVEKYEEIEELRAAMEFSCQRILCENVVTLEKFAEGYTDPLLGLTPCDDPDSDACKEAYLMMEGAKCPFADVLALSAAADDPGISLFDPSTWFCSDRRAEIEVIKSPTNDLFSALTCACTPALSTYLDVYADVVKRQIECLEGEDIMECFEPLFTFVCDMTLNALTCEGLDYVAFNENANLVCDPAGDCLDFSSLDEDERRDALARGYQITPGSFSIDTGEIAHAVCESAFGDGDIDWAGILHRATDYSTGSMGILCQHGENEIPCHCGTDYDNPTINCGNPIQGRECDYGAGPSCIGGVAPDIPSRASTLANAILSQSAVLTVTTSSCSTTTGCTVRMTLEAGATPPACIAVPNIGAATYENGRYRLFINGLEYDASLHTGIRQYRYTCDGDTLRKNAV